MDGDMISQVLKDKISSYYKDRVKFAQDYYRTHKINKWNVAFPYKLEFTNHKSYVGMCACPDRKIYLSEHHMRFMTWEGIADTINHELAHWVERRDIHGTCWKAAAVVMGADPTAKVEHKSMSRAWLIMLGDEVVGTCEKNLPDISQRYWPHRKKETLGKLRCVPNPDMIDNSKYGE